jgi:peptidoglycan/xylan/chitin deacetylase (PgdA/CDA1 family)
VRAILTFHSVDHSDSVLSIAPEQLRSLIRGVRAAGHEVVSLRALMESGASPNWVALTFDDGFGTVHEHALPVLREEGVTATLFATTGYLGRANDWPGQPEWVPKWPMLDWDQVEELAAAGWDIQAHTETHPDLRTMSDDAIRDEMSRSDAAIEERTGRRPDQFAYPYGFVNDRVVELASDRYAWCFTTEMAPLDGRGETDLRVGGVPRLDTYYFRSRHWHRHFGGVAFRSWVAGRAALRKLRAA